MLAGHIHVTHQLGLVVPLLALRSVIGGHAPAGQQKRTCHVRCTNPTCLPEVAKFSPYAPCTFPSMSWTR
eukprot:365807-Chlamydomonas_euryale.AAC.12